MWGGDPIPMLAGIGFSLRRVRGGSLNCVWVVQTHRGRTSVIFSPGLQGLCCQSRHEACHQTQESNPQSNPQAAGLKASTLISKPNKLQAFNPKPLYPVEQLITMFAAVKGGVGYSLVTETYRNCLLRIRYDSGLF